MIFLSPGVKTQEIDYSTYVGQVSTCTVGMIGGASRGPLNKAVLVTSPTDYIEQFGEPINDDFGGLAALEFLKQGNQLYYVRVAESTLKTAQGYLSNGAIIVKGKEPGTFFEKFSIAITAVDEFKNTFDITLYKDNLAEERFTGSIDPESEYFIENIKSNWVTFELNEDAAILPQITAMTGSGNKAFTYNTDGKWELKCDGSEPELTSITFNTSLAVANTTIKVVSDSQNVLVPGSVLANVTAADTTCSITIPEGTFDFSQADGTAAIPGKYSFNSYADSTKASLYAHGTVEVVSKTDTETTVKVLTNEPDNISPEAAAAFVNKQFKVVGTTFVQGAGYNLLNVDGSDAGVYITVESEIQAPQDAVPGDEWVKEFSIAVVTATGVSQMQYIKISAVTTGSSTSVPAGELPEPEEGTITIVTNADPIKLTGGDNGCPLTFQTVIGTSGKGLQIFRDSDELDINLIAAPGFWQGAVQSELINIAQTRADTLAILDPPQGLSRQEVLAYHNGTLEGENNPTVPLNSSYAAIYYPWVQIYDAYSGQNKWVPPSGVVLGAIAYNDREGQPWFAPAGLNRGMLSSVVAVERSLDEGSRDALYGNGNVINSIVNYKKQGITIWGQRTTQRKSSALDRVNVRRLMNLVRKSIAATSAYLVFEQNDSLTWRRWVGMVEPFLENIKQSRGLYDYRVVMDETTVTPYHQDRNEMPGLVYLQPTKTAEFIPISFILTSTGAEFTS